MVSFFISAYTLAWQNPMPPNVTIPERWQVHYKGNAGGATGIISGPDGEEIFFPGYDATGAMAATIHEEDTLSLSGRVILDRRRVDVTVRKDGYLAVSFPSILRDGVSGWARFDVWTKAKNGRQAVNAVMIALTRLDVYRVNDRDAESLRQELNGKGPITAVYPFDSLVVKAPFRFAGYSNSPSVSFEEFSGLNVGLQEKFPASVKWEDKKTLLGREIRWGEDGSGHAWASAMVSGGKQVSFVSSSVEARGAVLALLMALTYKKF